jgi:hypothetical protein
MDARTLAEQEQAERIALAYHKWRTSDLIWEKYGHFPMTHEREIAEEFAQHLLEQQWIKITDDPDSLPQLGKWYPVIIHGIVQHEMMQYLGDEGWTFDDEDINDPPKELVTAYFPLPAPPENHLDAEQGKHADTAETGPQPEKPANGTRETHGCSTCGMLCDCDGGPCSGCFDCNSDCDEDDSYPCEGCGGSGLAIEGWDCEECDGLGYWE